MSNKTARIISSIFNPKLTLAVYFVYLTLFRLNTNTLIKSIVLLYIVINFMFLNYFDHKYELLDKFDLKSKETRYIRYYAFATVLILCLFILKFFSSIDFITNLVFFSIVCISIIGIFLMYFFKFKLSAHIVFNEILLYYLMYGSTIRFPAIALLSLIIGTARIVLRKHSTPQIFISSTIVLLIFEIIIIGNVLF